MDQGTDPDCSSGERAAGLNFVHDQRTTGRRFRVLNIVDNVTRACLAAIPDILISSARGARELTALIARRGRPAMIVSDNALGYRVHLDCGFELGRCLQD